MSWHPVDAGEARGLRALTLWMHQRNARDFAVEEMVSDPSDHRIAPRSGEGDAQRMRCIPVMAHGVSGVIPGTRPDLAVLRLDPRER